MAACAVGLECGKLPVNNFAVVLVAFRALKIAAVIERLIRQTGVAEIGWSPCVGAMTQTAVLCGVEMPGILAGRGSAIVAGRARAEDLIVVHRGDGFPDISVMAVLANIGCLYVQRSLARRVSAVVTANAIVDDIHVIEVRRHPGDARVAVVAVVAARNMGRVLAGGDRAVMT